MMPMGKFGIKMAKHVYKHDTNGEIQHETGENLAQIAKNCGCSKE